jgi:hypothetical protein
MDMDMGMESLRDDRKDRRKGKGMDHHLGQDKDRDRDASIESCPTLLGIDEMGESA